MHQLRHEANSMFGRRFWELCGLLPVVLLAPSQQHHATHHNMEESPCYSRPWWFLGMF
jgi:hypothetical protein